MRKSDNVNRVQVDTAVQIGYLLNLCFIWASLILSQWTNWYHELPFSSSFVYSKWNSPLIFVLTREKREEEREEELYWIKFNESLDRATSAANSGTHMHMGCMQSRGRSRRAGIFTSIEFLEEENKIFSASWCDVILHRHHQPTHLYRSFISVLERSFTTNNLSQIATASILHCVACCWWAEQNGLWIINYFYTSAWESSTLEREEMFFQQSIELSKAVEEEWMRSIEKKSSSAEPLGGD